MESTSRALSLTWQVLRRHWLSLTTGLRVCFQHSFLLTMHPRCPQSLPEPCPHVQADATPCSLDCSIFSHMAPLHPLRCCDRDTSKCSRIRDDGILHAERRRVVREFNRQGDTEAVSENKQRFTNLRRKKWRYPGRPFQEEGKNVQWAPYRRACSETASFASFTPIFSALYTF